MDKEFAEINGESQAFASDKCRGLSKKEYMATAILVGMVHKDMLLAGGDLDHRYARRAIELADELLEGLI